MKRALAPLAVAVALSAALWSPVQSGAAAGKPFPHNALLGPMAQAALVATSHGHHLPASWLVGRYTRRGTTYGVFLRGSTSARAIAATGAVPGTVLSVGATAEATLSELNALAAIPGITEVELAGKAQEQLDQSVPAIHASEPGHANTAGVPHLWSGNGGSAESHTDGGTTLWQYSTTCSLVGGGTTPVVYGGEMYDRNANFGNKIFNATTGAVLGTFNATPAPAFDGTTGFFVSGGVLSAIATGSGAVLWTFSGDGTTGSAPITAPIVVNHNVFVGAASGEVFALPAAGNGTSVNVPTWTGNAGAAIDAPIESGASAPLSGLGAGNGLLVVPAGSSLVAFGDTSVKVSADTMVSYQVDANHDGDQPSDSITTPLATSPKWSVNLGAPVSYPLIVGGKVYVTTGNSITTELYALNQADGSIAWGPVHLLSSQPVVSATYAGGDVFTVTFSGIVTAYDAATGSVIWTERVDPNAAVDSPIVAADGVLYYSAQGSSAVYALEETTGALLWSSPVEDGQNSAPAVTSTGVYVTYEGCQYTYDFSPGINIAATPPTFVGDTGQGTVVGVVDTGIDLANQDFQTIAGTRIVDLWDQDACPTQDLNGCPTQPPNSGGYTYGAECSQASINSATCGPFLYGATCEDPPDVNNDNWLPEEDCDGHGTHVAGIAASNGRAASPTIYIGVAPQADLVIVKSDGSLADVIDGVDYVFKVAAARGEPASVNLSLGTYEGPHDGSDMFETMLDALTGAGRLITVAAGNEATNNATLHYHASAAVTDGQVRTDGLLVEAMPVFIDLWYPGNASISAAVSETGYAQTPWVSPDTSGVSGEDGTCIQGVPGDDQFENSQQNVIEILSCTHMPSNGMNEIQLEMFNASGGVGTLLSPDDAWCSYTNPCTDDFKLLLRGNSPAAGTYNAWTFDQGDYFFYQGDGNDRSTLDEPGSARDVISVGSYVTRNSWPSESGTESDSSMVGAISSFSGEGPTLDGRPGITIAAPGEEIGSSLSAAASTAITSDCPALTTAGCTSPDGNHLFLQGTSMASPHAAGAIALLLEQQPTIDPAQAKSLLTQSANTSPLTSGGAATTWGAGKLEVGPGVLSISPSHGPLIGGNTIDITGVDLQTGVTMSLGGHALALTNVATNEWSAPVPAATKSGAVSLTISNPDGSTAVDALAYLYVDPTAYHALTPFRICDTRTTAAANECQGKTLGAGGTVNVQITGGAVPSTAESVVVNLTAVNHSADGTYVTAYPSGGSVPLASNMNLSGPGVQSNLAIVQLSTSGALTVYNAVGSVDVIVDVQGYFSQPTGLGTVPGEFHSIPPLRICDTRAGQNTECAGSTNEPLAGGTWRDVVLSGLPPGAAGGTPSIPADGTAAAAVFNLTATQATAATYLTVAPPSSTGACPTKAPSASNVNPQPGTSLPIRVIAPLGPHHDVCVFNSVGSTEFIIDVDGWFGTGAESTAGALFYSMSPTRLCDTRLGSPTECTGMTLQQDAAIAIPIAGVGNVPALGSSPPVALVANLTAVGGSAATYLALYPSDVTRPRASDLNPAAGEVIANLSIVGIAQTGESAGDVSLFNAVGTINAILDVAGWFE